MSSNSFAEKIKSVNNLLLAKLIIVLLLTIIATHFFTEYATQEYMKGMEITQTGLPNDLTKYEKETQTLLDYQPYTNSGFSFLVVLVGISLVVGAYEITVLLISFLIGKSITRREKLK